MTASLREIPRLAAGALAVGLVAAFAALVFVEFAAALAALLYTAPGARDGLSAPLRIAVVLCAPTLAGLVCGLLLAKAGGAAHGPADVIRAAAVVNPPSSKAGLDLRGGALSALAAALSLGGGASVGQYGPVAHLGALVGAPIARLFGVGAAPLALACGVAAAISAVFSAPVAGLVFAHEVVLRHYAPRAFAPTAVAAVAANLLSTGGFARRPFLPVETMANFAPAEAAMFLLLGAIGGMLAALMMRAIFSVNARAARSRIPRILRPAFGGLLTGVIALAAPDVLGAGKHILEALVSGGGVGGGSDGGIGGFGGAMAGGIGGEVGGAAFLLIAKLAATILCLGLGFAGGVFSPSLVIGALLGALCGALAGALLGAGASPVFVYVLCGMFALAAPVIGAPIASILIVLELTRNYPATLAAVLAIAAANLFASRFCGGSYYTLQIQAMEKREGAAG